MSISKGLLASSSGPLSQLFNVATLKSWESGPEDEANKPLLILTNRSSCYNYRSIPASDLYSDLRFILLVFTDFAATILDELFNSALKWMHKFGIIYTENSKE